MPTNLDGVVGQRAEITDYGAMVFNPSSVDRLSHTLIGAFIMVGLLVHRFFRGKVKLDRSSC